MGGQRDPASVAWPTDEVRAPSAHELARLFARSPADAPRPATDATLTITRDAPDDVQDRIVMLWVDDEPWPRLRYGQTLTRAIPHGRHRVRAHNTLLGTIVEFDAAPGEHVQLRCSNTLARGSMLLFWLIHWAAIRVRLDRL